MLSTTELMILAHLRKNARQSLTLISKKTNTPISTVYDKLHYRYRGVVQKFTTLVDFSTLGFNTRAHVILRVDKEERAKLREYLINHQNVNSLYRINNGYDFLLEGIFCHLKELDSFMDYLDSQFILREKQVYYIIEDMKREDFLTNPQFLPQNDLLRNKPKRGKRKGQDKGLDKGLVTGREQKGTLNGVESRTRQEERLS